MSLKARCHSKGEENQCPARATGGDSRRHVRGRSTAASRHQASPGTFPFSLERSSVASCSLLRSGSQPLASCALLGQASPVGADVLRTPLRAPLPPRARRLELREAVQGPRELGAWQSGSPCGKWPEAPRRIAPRAGWEDAEKPVVQTRQLVSQAVSPTRIWLTCLDRITFSCLIILTTVLKSVSSEKRSSFLRVTQIHLAARPDLNPT